ncbi:MAG: DUF2007 domain-containing protein [Bacteroidales bacterium]|nr:DUF2007 domain-containing protein [Bacteroidales bacterium]
MESWVSIFNTDKPYLAEIAKEVLFDHGIQAVVINKRDSSYLFGSIEVHVPQDQAIRGKIALQTLNDSPEITGEQTDE